MEWALITAAKKGAPWAVQWYLKHQARERGYQEQQAAPQEQVLKVEVSYSDDVLRPMAARLTEALPLPPTPEVIDAESSEFEPRVGAPDGQP